MKTSPAGRAFIGLHEGLRLTAYKDAVGVWTVGYGHTAAAGDPAPFSGMKITAADADAILERDLAKFEAAVDKLVVVPLAQREFDALVSFAFNLGEGNLRASTLLRKLNTGDKAGAAAEFPKWNKAGGRVLAGLTRRRAEERAMFSSGVYTGVPESVPRSVGNVIVPAKPVEAVDARARTIARLNLRKAYPSGEIILTLPDDHPVEIRDTGHLVRTVVNGEVHEGFVAARFVNDGQE